MPALGYKSYVAFGPKESVYGTFQTPTKKLEVTNWTVTPALGVVGDDSLWGRVSRRTAYQMGRSYKASFSTRCNYEGLEEFFRAVLGSYSNTTVGGSTRDHRFAEGDSLNSYSFEMSLGDTPSGKVFRLTGCKLTGFTLKGAAGTGADGMLSLDFNVVAQDYTTNQTPTAEATAITVSNCSLANLTVTRGSGSFITDGVTVGMTAENANIPSGTVVIAVAALTVTLSAPVGTAGSQSVSFRTLQAYSPIPVLFHQATTTDDGTTDAASSIRIRSFECTVESAMTEERFYIGSSTIDEPVRDGFMTVKWKFTQEFNTKTAFDAARAQTTGSPQMVFTHPTEINPGGTSYKREFEVRSGNAFATEWGVPIEGPGILIATVGWEAYFDPTDQSSLVVRTRNNLPALS